MSSGMGRLYSRHSAVETARRLSARGKRLVFTNGVFDLVHAGHISYLVSARELGDFMLVGLNSDQSARALKGPERPYVPQADRAAVLLALRSVDGVVIFDELTASTLVDELRPDIYVKGGDYALSGTGPGVPLPEEPTVRAYGGEVHLIAFRQGYSTSDLIARIRAGVRREPRD